MDYVLERVVWGREGSGDPLLPSRYVPYSLEDVGVGLVDAAGGTAGVSSGLGVSPGAGLSSVEASAVFQETALEDARERLMSRYGASGVVGLICAWRGPRMGMVGRRRRRVGEDGAQGGEHCVYCVSVHGETRRELRLWCLIPGSGSYDDAARGVNGGGSQCCHVTVHDMPVEAVSVCPPKSDDMEDGMGPVVAVRSISSIAYYQVVYGSEDGHVGREGRGGSSRRAGQVGRGAAERLVRLAGRVGVGSVKLGIKIGPCARLRDFSWSQFASLSALDGVVLDDDGMLWEVSASGQMAPTSTTSSRAFDYECVTTTVDQRKREQRQGERRHEPLPHHFGARRCVASPLHPRLNLVAWEGGVVRVDFREKRVPQAVRFGSTDRPPSNRARVVCDTSGEMGSFVTSLAVPSRVAGGSHSDLRRFAISTTSHVHLYDMRKTAEPVVSWEHYMKYPPEDFNTSTVVRRTSWDMQTCFPDGLHFVKDGILVTNSISGTGMVCRWKVVEPAPKIGFDGGSLRWIGQDPGDDGHDGTHNAASPIMGNNSPLIEGRGRADGLRFMWRPISLERVEPIEPPQLLYSDTYPEQSMPSLIRDQALKVLEMENRWDEIDDGGRVTRQRVLPARTPPVFRRDFGQVVVGSSIIRYGTLGEILMGTLAESNRRTLDLDSIHHEPRREEVDVDVVTVEVPTRHPTLPTAVPNCSAHATRTSSVSVTQSYSVHEWLKARAQKEITSGAIDYLPTSDRTSIDDGINGTTDIDGIQNMSIDGMPVPQLRLFLLGLIKRLDGIPISAYEAWDIFQKQIAAQDPQHASRIIEKEILLFSGGGRDDRNEGSRGDGEDGGADTVGTTGPADADDNGLASSRQPSIEPYTILASYLDAKRLMPLLKSEWPRNSQQVSTPNMNNPESDDSYGEQEPLDAVQSVNQRTLTPSRAFLTVWASLGESDGILSRRGRDPRALQHTIQQLTALNLGNEHSETNTRQGNTHTLPIAPTSPSPDTPLTPSTIIEASISFKAWMHASRDAQHPVRYRRDLPVISERIRQKLEKLRTSTDR